MDVFVLRTYWEDGSGGVIHAVYSTHELAIAALKTLHSGSGWSAAEIEPVPLDPMGTTQHE